MKLYTAYDYGRGEPWKAVQWQKEWDAPEVARKIRKIEVEGRAEEWYEWRDGKWRLGPGSVRP